VAGFRGRGGTGCAFIGGVFVWPQAELLQRVGISSGLAWLIALALMVIFPIVGYLLGMRLFPLNDRSGPPAE